MMRIRGLFLSVWLAALGCGLGDDDRRAPVVLITMDTTRPDHLSVYGYAKPTSPHLERLAQPAPVTSEVA